MSYESTVKQQDMVINIIGFKPDAKKVEEQKKELDQIKSLKGGTQSLLPEN